MPTPESFNQALVLLAPELVLLATVCVMFLVGPFLADDSGNAAPGVRRGWSLISLAALATAGWLLIRAGQTPTTGGPFAADGLAFYVRAMTLALGAALVMVLSRQVDAGSSAEANGCLLAMLAGTNLVVLVTDLAGLFLALELISIPTYVFLYLPRKGAAMQEAALKYFMLSVFSSALVLFGMSWVYGATGTMHFAEMTDGLRENAGSAGHLVLLAGVALMTAGLSYRMTAAPFHFYAPDVFQGVNSASAAMLSYVPKAAGFAAIVRVLSSTMGPLGEASVSQVEMLLGVIALATMTLGNLLALRQHNLHRLLAYSGVAHSGYMLAGLAVGQTTDAGVPALWFYMATYALVTIGIFALLAGANAEAPLRVDVDLAGLSQSRPGIAILMTVCLLSLIGLPPTVGFTGKLNLFFASWGAPTAWGKWLAVSIAVNAAVAAWYYLRLIAMMYRESPSGREPAKVGWSSAAAGAACAVATVALFAMPQRLMDLALAIGR